MALIWCGLCGSRGTAASREPGAGESSVVQLVEKLSSGSFQEEPGREWRKQIHRDIERKIQDAFSTDPAKAKAAETAQRELKEIGQAIKDACKKHKEARKGVDDANALMYLGPIALRAYIDVAKRHHVSELFPILGKIVGDYLLSGFSTKILRDYQRTTQEGWDHEFLANCSEAVCDAMAGYGRLLAAERTSDSQVRYQQPEALIQTLEGIRQISSVVDPNDDLFALQYILVCPARHGRDIGNASRSPMVALARMVTDPGLAPEPRRAAIEAVGAVSSAYGVFFRAVRSLPDTLKTDLPSIALAIDRLVLGGAGVFLKNMKRPAMYAAEEYTFPSRITSQFVTLLKFSDKDTQCSAATALGRMVPPAMGYVDLISEMLILTGDNLDPGASRDIFSLASSNFEAIFALANAATGDDPAADHDNVRRHAGDSLRRIFGVSGSGPNRISDLVGRLITLLNTKQHPVVENEVFNSLLAIPSATRETISRMDDVERTGASPETRAYAQKNGECLCELAKTTASRIREEFTSTTDLYRARRYLLILRLYGEALPDRPTYYFLLLCAHASPRAKTELAVRLLVAQEALQAFKSTNGTGRDVEKGMLDHWRFLVNKWKGCGQDGTMQQYLAYIDGEIGRLVLEGYSIPHRLWQRFSQLSRTVQVSLVLGLAYVFAVVVVGVLWLAAPWYLTDRAMENPMSERFPLSTKRAMDFVSWVHWLGATNRALDAWVARHQGSLVSQAFRLGGESQPLAEDVPDRVEYLIDHYVDIGNRKHVDAFCDAIRGGKPLAVWIEGEGGGSGKTTLACHMARVARDGAGRPVIPVIVNVDWGQSLMDAVRRLCQIDGRLLTLTMIRNLAGRGRIILIVDGLSEIRATLDGEAAAFHYVLVTSRDKPPEDKEYSTVQVGSLTVEDTARLDAFVAAYTQKEETRDRAMKLIRGLADARGCIRPVFAWLAVDHAEEHADPLFDKDHYSQLDLIMTCVRRQRQRGLHALNEDSYGRAAELVAYIVINYLWTPQMVPREAVQLRLHDEGTMLPFRSSSGGEIPGDTVLGHLEQCGLLKSGSIRQSSSFAGRSFISFAHDVVAEYLAAVYVCKWPKIPSSTRKKIQQSSGGFAEIFETVQRAMMDPEDKRPA